MQRMSEQDLPNWAREMVPVGHEQAARLLGMSKTQLYRLVRRHPHYERRGKGFAYYPEHIKALRAVARGDGEKETKTWRHGFTGTETARGARKAARMGSDLEGAFRAVRNAKLRRS